MKELYKKFLKENIDLSPLGVGRREENPSYFCTPKGADIIGWAGVDGIHFCFVRGFGEMVFAVSPMNTPGNYVHPVAENFRDFLSLLLACGDSAAIEQAWFLDNSRFDTFLFENEPTEEQRAVLNEIVEKFGLEPIEDPFEYIKSLQDKFDYSKIKYPEDYSEWVPEETKPPKWKVVYQGNFWTRQSRERAGIEIPINRKFDWCGKQWLIPAAYSCAKGLVIDSCIRVEAEEIRAFTDKWKLSRENDDISFFTREQQMKLEAENPLSLSFNSKVRVNGTEIERRHGCAVTYNPCFEDGECCELEAKWVVDHYKLDSTCGWMIWRECFPWSTKRRPEVKQLSIALSQDLVSLPGPRFTVAKPGDTFTFDCPLTNQPHTLTVQEYEHSEFPKNLQMFTDMEYPKNYTAMSYTLSPELPRDAISISDCSEGDRPRPKQTPDGPSPTSAASIGIIGGADGPTAIIFGGSGQGQPRAAFSSLHFEPVDEVDWFITFREKKFEDIEVELL